MFFTVYSTMIFLKFDNIGSEFGSFGSFTFLRFCLYPILIDDSFRTLRVPACETRIAARATLFIARAISLSFARAHTRVPPFLPPFVPSRPPRTFSLSLSLFFFLSLAQHARRATISMESRCARCEPRLVIILILYASFPEDTRSTRGRE